MTSAIDRVCIDNGIASEIQFTLVSLGCEDDSDLYDLALDKKLLKKVANSCTSIQLLKF